jgi:dsRNA-specific ribonuclease
MAQAEGATKKLAAQRAAQQVYQRLLDQPAETRLP